MIYGGIEININDYGNPVAYIGDDAIQFATLAEAEEYIDEIQERNYDVE